ncbi:M23 family metallopeptidase [Paenibacillus sp. 481]|uniref:M23 family metallopeptidase n=1 Tax=Paenibacillus sp. 481 TaxID=2835869 RepID=UPI001E2FA92E|nr:M23 family metallopeptidase [Paenibacillus sp. 481]UHA74353.1 M23 family metallopeptidase [Paenibacillus sp. 481]
MKEDIRRRRQERIRQLTCSESVSAGETVEVGSYPMLVPHDAVRTSHLTDKEDTDLERDPEMQWREKAANMHWYEGYGKHHHEQEGGWNMWGPLRLRIVAAVMITIVAVVILRFPADWNAPMRGWIAQAFTQEMNTEAVAAWYESAFAGTPSFIPLFSNTNKETQSASARKQLWQAPIAGTIVQPFALSLKGIHIQPSSSGAEVVSAGTGRIIATKEDPRNRTVNITVQHEGGWITEYGQLEQSVVQVNDWIEAGTKLGKMKGGKNPESSRLFFAVQKDGRYVDPTDVMHFD